MDLWPLVTLSLHPTEHLHPQVMEGVLEPIHELEESNHPNHPRLHPVKPKQAARLEHQYVVAPYVDL